LKIKKNQTLSIFDLYGKLIDSPSLLSRRVYKDGGYNIVSNLDKKAIGKALELYLPLSATEGLESLLYPAAR